MDSRASGRSANRTLDCLRALAALLVVAGHLRNLLFLDYPSVHHDMWIKMFYAITSLGSQAVFVFFALSGYWVGGWVLRHWQRGDFSWANHLFRRLLRLWIVLLPALVLTFVACEIGQRLFAHNPLYVGSAAFNGLAPAHLTRQLSWLSALGNVFFLQPTWVNGYGNNGSLWSLGYEFWYYLLFPTFLALASGKRQIGRLLLCVGSIAALVVLLGYQGTALFSAWLVGAAAAWISEPARKMALRYIPVSRLGLSQLVVFSFAWLVCALMQVAHIPAPAAALTDALAAAFFIVLASVEVEGIGRGTNLILTTGHSVARFSYTLYATHLPLAVLLVAALDPSGKRYSPGLHPLMLAILALVILLVASFGLFLVFERHTDAWRASILGVISPSSNPNSGYRPVPR